MERISKQWPAASPRTRSSRRFRRRCLPSRRIDRRPPRSRAPAETEGRRNPRPSRPPRPDAPATGGPTRHRPRPRRTCPRRRSPDRSSPPPPEPPRIGAGGRSIAASSCRFGSFHPLPPSLTGRAPLPRTRKSARMSFSIDRNDALSHCVSTVIRGGSAIVRRSGNFPAKTGLRPSPSCCYRSARPAATPGLTQGSGCSSGVEHNLAKVGVEGSNPFARSNFPQ